MITFLDVLGELLTDTRQQRAYRRDPTSWLVGHHCGDLCGEDVVEALPALRRRLPDLPLDLDVDVDPSPEPGETELDAAARQIDSLLDGLDGADR